jgi:hypothetical protein
MIDETISSFKPVILAGPFVIETMLKRGEAWSERVGDLPISGTF